MAGRILIVDGTATNRLSLRVRLEAACYTVDTADDAAAAIMKSDLYKPDLMIAAADVGGCSGTEISETLKSRPGGQDLSTLLLVDGPDPSTRLDALRSGVDDVLSKPFADVALMARVRSLLRARETRVETQRRRKTAASFGFAETSDTFETFARIGLIADHTAGVATWAQDLKTWTRDTLVCLEPETALDQANRDTVADAFIIADTLQRPGGGLALLADLRSRPGTRQAAIIFAHSNDDAGAGAHALDLGANDLVPLDVDPAELAIRLRTQLRRKREADRLRNSVEDGLRLAATDPLTGLYNRRYAMTYLDRVAQECAENGRPFAVMVADLDHFKAINDHYGHTVGDAVLKQVAHTIRDSLRSVDLVARLGGEEFLVVMPDTDFSRARPAAERLCRMVATIDAPTPQADRPSVTMSIGMAIAEGGSDRVSQPHGLIDRADQALYRAKAAGRNTVSLWRPAA